MRSYELVLVTKASLSGAPLKKLITSIKSLLNNFKITKEEEIGKKQLAYTIKREVDGYYWDFMFEGEEGVTKDLEKKLGEFDNILRHLVLRTK